MAELVVVGGGPAGLATALFAARAGHRATVLERDGPPPTGAEPEDDFSTWSRRGVSHARQGHVFLARSTKVMREEAPDVVRTIVRQGGAESPLAVDRSERNILARRLVYEATLRRIVESEAGIDVGSGELAAGLVFRDLNGMPRVVGVRTDSGVDVPADIVVDAAGRRSQSLQWLREAGLKPARETCQRCGFFYVTRHYKLRKGESFPSCALPLVMPLDYATVLAFPGDNGRYQLSIAVSVDDPCRHKIRTPEAFERVLGAVSLTAPWIECGEAIDDPHIMSGIENRWRRLVDRNRPVACGYVLIGDAAMQTNPTTGRGISFAFMQAQRLAKTLDQAAVDPAGFLVAFERWMEWELGGWFDSQLAIDAARIAQLRAGLRSEHLPPPLDPTNRLVAAMTVLGEEDPIVRARAIRLYNLLINPRDLLEDRRFARRLLAYIRAHPQPDVRVQGPDRMTFERLVAA